MKKVLIFLTVVMMIGSVILFASQKIKPFNVLAPLSPQIKKQLKAVSLGLRDGKLDSADRNLWQEAIRNNRKSPVPADVNDLILWVINDMKKEMNSDIKFLKERLRYLNALANEMSDYLKELEEAAGNRNSGAGMSKDPPKIFQLKDFKPALAYAARLMKRETGSGLTFHRQVSPKIQTIRNTAQPTLSMIKNQILKRKEELKTIRGNAQEAMIDLDDSMAMQSRIIQIQSNISKVLHDVAMGSIRNMK